jgi:uncharacterized membrane protein
MTRRPDRVDAFTRTHPVVASVMIGIAFGLLIAASDWWFR